MGLQFYFELARGRDRYVGYANNALRIHSDELQRFARLATHGNTEAARAAASARELSVSSLPHASQLP